MISLIQFIVTAIFIVLLSEYLPGIELQDSYKSAFIFAILLALVNIFLGGLLRIITLPIRMITLGLFSFVILFIVVYVTDELLPGVTITGVLPYVLIAFGNSAISLIFKLFR